MKKLLVLVALVAMSAVAVNAQPRAIGARLGYGIDFSYQHSLGERNMVQLEVGLPAFSGISAAATYDWLFPISSWQEAGSWNWYAGVGAGAGYSWLWGWGNYGYVGVAGRLGIEYNFDFPLSLSLDWRPVIGPGFSGGNTYFNSGSLYAGAIAWGIRYRF